MQCEVLQTKRIKSFSRITGSKNIRPWRRKLRNLFRSRYEKRAKNIYMKIERLRGNTVPIIIANLHEACSHDVVNHSTVAQWFK